MKNAHTIKDFGPSDIMSSGIEGRRRVKVSSEDVFATAVENGVGYGSSLKITIPAGAEYSVKMIGNSEFAVRQFNAHGLFIEYYDGESAGDLVGMSGGYPLNEIDSSGHEFYVEIYDDHPTGNRLISDANTIKVPYITSTSCSFEIANTTDSEIVTFVSVLFEAISDPVAPYGLRSDTLLSSTTEMSDYNGPN